MDQRTHYEKAETCLTLSEQADPESADRLLKAAQVHAHLAGDYKPPEEWSIDRAKIGQITLTDSGGEAHSTGAALQFPEKPVDVTEEPPVGSHIACGVCGERPDSLLGHVDCAPDVDPDEALARVAHMAFWGGRMMPSPDSEAWLDVARAVREHIEADVERLTRERDDVQDLVFGFRARIKAAEAERGDANVRYETQTRRAEKAEAEVQRLTYLLGSHADGHRCTCEMTDPGVYHGENMHPPEWEQDPWCPTHPDMNVILTEVKRLRDGIDVIRSEARRGARIATVPGERRLLRAMHLYLSGLLEPKPPTDFPTLLNQTEGETDE